MRHPLRSLRPVALVVLVTLPLAACGNSWDRVGEIGKSPKLSTIDDPTAKPGYKAVSMPMPVHNPPAYAPASLWSQGSRAFFKDQRAHRVGDILTVQVVITDKAKIANETARGRAESESTSVGGLPGAAIDGLIKRSGASASNLISNTTKSSQEGTGSVDRSEQLQTNVAALVTQVLPNGNLVIEGRQEVRVNFEVRELIVAGVVRPEDIGSDNTIESTKIAEARISYGGRGQITDVQQARYGTQFLDVIMPF
ncbi:MAG: flagellar basal body L-ring protein FlgH [Siculibacillus sp.]|nr:flagellar basal body L-ring protein FlgH [Siculibacillus sp.]